MGYDMSHVVMQVTTGSIAKKPSCKTDPASSGSPGFKEKPLSPALRENMSKIYFFHVCKPILHIKQCFITRQRILTMSCPFFSLSGYILISNTL